MSSEPVGSERLSKAIALAAKAHKRDKYNDRDPYVFHPIRVMFRVPEEARVVAVLHDVLEDTDEAAPGWLTDDERKALDLLTHRKDEHAYEEYIERLATADGKSGALARQVKVGDSSDHLVHDPKPHLEARYRWVLERLTPLLAGTEGGVERTTTETPPTPEASQVTPTGATAGKEYPIPRRSISEDWESAEIGWDRGKLNDGRPFLAECWAEGGMTALTFFFSTLDLERTETPELTSLLVESGLIRFNVEPEGHRAVKMTDEEGNELWSLTLIVGIGKEVFLEDALELKSHR